MYYAEHFALQFEKPVVYFLMIVHLLVLEKVVVIELCYRLSVVIMLCCYLCCSVIIVFFYVLIVCTVTLPQGVNPIAVDKYIYIYLSISNLVTRMSYYETR